MSVIKMIRKRANQTAVYWGNPVNDGRGKYTFDAPVEVLVRWEDEIENFAKDSRSRIRIDKDGREYRTNAIAYSVDPPASGWQLDGYLYLGTIASLNGETDPYKVDEAYEIKQIDYAGRLTKPTEKVYAIYL